MAERATADTGPSAKATTKAALVDAGTQLILEQGYHHTGIQDVLQAAGVPKGSFYYYFPSKEAFGREVIAQFAAAYVERLERWLGDTTQSPLTRLHRHLDETLTHFERRGCRGGCLIGNLSQELADQSAPFGAQLEAVFADWRERYARLFREAQAVGELRADLDPQQVAEFYLNSFEGAVLRAKVSKSPAPLRLFMTLMFDGVLRGNPAAR
jgi:TetR/AcrR family transcriptional regulator, transcriptional repressor for nem operon